MYENLRDDDPPADPTGLRTDAMKSDIAGGDEYDAGERMREEITFEQWEWDGTEVKITPLTHKREEER